MKISKLKKYSDKKVAILWYGIEWKSNLDFIIKLWFKNITILDKYKILEQEKKLKYISWENYLENLEDFDLIIKSPWISPYTNKQILNFKWKIISGTEIFLENYNWKVIWITWTKGKSTTASLTYELLKNAWFKVKLVWNIWNSVLSEIDILNESNYDYIVYELSSFMLENIEPKLFIWVLLNIYKDHLDWYNGDFEKYKKSKNNILKKSLNKVKSSEIKNLQKFETKLIWEHNLKNINTVLKISEILKINKKVFIQTIKNFKWLKHRLQNIWTYNEITFIDDAISTTPESTIEALKTYKENIWTIFLWWTDRWYDFDELISYINKYNIENIVLLPDSWIRIFEKLSTSHNIINTSSMKEAIKFAFENTKEWKICILSCASPSYSLRKNYIEKGNEFKKYILKYTKH
jgi:UDP-N-acetylmuramoylalanine--D-glutamate ligase